MQKIILFVFHDFFDYAKHWIWFVAYLEKKEDCIIRWDTVTILHLVCYQRDSIIGGPDTAIML